MGHSDIELYAQAAAWVASDPDPVTRAELQSLINAGDTATLSERFAAPLPFGTAGLRGIMGAGLARMNVANIIRVTAGLGDHLLAEVDDAANRGVVVGRDGRIGSDVFARAAAEVLAAKGIRVYWLADPAPTPVCAFVGHHNSTASTVIVTASHNPPAYNGYKVYSPRGSQIVPPQDGQIRDAREAIGPANEVPRLAFVEAVRQGLIKVVGPRDFEAYLDALDAQCLAPVPPPTQVSAVTTALHGVGHAWVSEALMRRGHRHIFPVLAQAAPDGRFPTVAFPNPEEDGALDLSFELGREKFAEVVLANDPDTDRLCVAVRDASHAEGYVKLTGNQLGILLADWLLGEGARLGRLPAKPLVGTTIVSTMQLEQLAAARGAAYGEVLTGFKWIWDLALRLEPVSGETFVFGFEEAIGYCCGQAVRDKDGVGAAQILMELASTLKAQDLTLLDRLDQLAEEFGVYSTDQVALVLPGLEGKARIGRLMTALREKAPQTIAGSAVERQRDLAGIDADNAGLPRSNVLTYWLADGSRVVCRPSGTEPKIKCYLETRAPIGDDGSIDSAQDRADTRLGELAAWITAFIDTVP
ncbi:MAG: phosphomannomutase [Myxococcota bacterium]